MKRVVWFSAGVVTGAAGSVYGYVRLRRSVRRPAAERVVDAVAGTARSGVDGARRFIDDARQQIRTAEAELRSPGPPGDGGGSRGAGDAPGHR
jgi:hypothetical protein